MKNKDTILLENAYEKVLIRENDNLRNLNSIKSLTWKNKMIQRLKNAFSRENMEEYYNFLKNWANSSRGKETLKHLDQENQEKETHTISHDLDGYGDINKLPENNLQKHINTYIFVYIATHYGRDEDKQPLYHLDKEYDFFGRKMIPNKSEDLLFDFLHWIKESGFVFSHDFDFDLPLNLNRDKPIKV